MAVVYRGKHHRNPSGRRNKIKWLLSVGKWNPREMERITTNVVRETGNKDWYTVLAHAELHRLHAELHRLHAIDLDRQVITDLKEYLKRHKGCPHYIEDNISSILSYIKECDYSLEVTNHEDTGYSWGQVEEGYEDGFKEGAEFGYNKANEWHYPSKGEYPKEGEAVWCYCKGPGIKFCCVGNTIVGSDNNKVRWWANNKTEELRVIAWKEIVLPKESK